MGEARRRDRRAGESPSRVRGRRGVLGPCPPRDRSRPPAGTAGRPQSAALAPFAVPAADAAAAPAELLLSLAGELRSVDVTGATCRLETLADRLRQARRGVDWLTPVAVEDLLDVVDAFRVAGDRDPEGFLLDTVIAARRGHPVVLAVVVQEVARRAGIPLAVLGSGDLCVVGDVRGDPAVLVDVTGRSAWPQPSSPPQLLRPRCAHEIALVVVSRLVAAYRLRGDLERAIRAAELRLELPFGEPLRQHLGRERDHLRANLN